LDKEERELQIRLAQINTKIQIALAMTFGWLGATLALLAFSYEIYHIYFVVSYISLFVTFMVLYAGYVSWNRVMKYFTELKDLK